MNRRINKFLALTILMLITVAGTAQTLSRNELQNLRRMAEAFERAAQFQQAADFYIRLALNNPNDTAAYLGAKRACQGSGDWLKFRDFILQLQRQRRDIRYAVDLALIEYQLGDREAARKSWLQLLDENPQNESAYHLIGQTMIELQMYEDAVKAYQRGRKELKNSALFGFELANLFSLLGRTDEMMEEYFNFLSINPAQIHFLQALIAQVRQTQHSDDKVIAALETILKKRNDMSWAAHFLLAGLYEQQRRFDKAFGHHYALEKQLEAINSENRKLPYESGAFLFEFADTALKEGEPRWAQQAYHVIVAEFSESPFAGRAKWKVADVYLANHQYDQAAGFLEQFIADHPRAPEAQDALVVLGQIYLGPLFLIEKAEAAFTLLKENRDPKRREEAYLQLAQCAAIRGQFEKAEQLLTTAHRRNASKGGDAAAKALFDLAMLELYRQQPKSAMDYLEQAQAAFTATDNSLIENDVLHLSLLLYEGSRDSAGIAAFGHAKLLILQRRYDRARALLEARITEAPNSPIRNELQLTLADLFYTIGEIDASIDVYQRIYQDENSFYRDLALFAAAELYESLKQEEQARGSYEKLLVEFPNSIYLDQARKRIRTIERKVLP